MVSRLLDSRRCWVALAFVFLAQPGNVTGGLQSVSAVVDRTPERAGRDELRSSGDAPLWLDDAGRLAASARDALLLLNHAADDGLDPADYDVDLLGDLAARIELGSSAPSDLARFDGALSAGMSRYLHDLHVGRVDPRAAGFQLEAPRDRHDFAALLRAAIAERRLTRVAEDLRPPLSQYRLLRDALARYRSLAARSTFIVPPPFTSTVHAGEPYAAVAALRHELAMLGDLPADTSRQLASARYEGAVVEGVKRFQTRHGLQPDGVLGKGTIAALRVPMTSRVRQIELALERLRWLPHAADERLIALNIPMFRLWAWDSPPPSDAPALGMDAIVGRALRTQTPAFVAQMREVIFRPYWNVPSSILRHEVLPKIERDPDYLRRENMEIVGGMEGDGVSITVTADALEGLRRGALRVRQRPGPANSLGLIKFVFPNEQDVYMHGTPAQPLFARSRRDFSHGCVRVRDPIALATWVLGGQAEWTPERIVAATGGQQTLHVKLARPIRVILFYATAAVMPEDGTIRFAEDIYRQDAMLDRALASRRADQ